MEAEEAIKSVKSRIRDRRQEERLTLLVQRVTAAFKKARAKGVREELESDWATLRTKFGVALKVLQKETGLY